MASFPEKITSMKDIVTGSFLDFFGSHVFGMFFHVLYFGIFLGELFLRRVASHPIHPSSPGSAPDFAKFLVIFCSSAPLLVFY